MSIYKSREKGSVNTSKSIKKIGNIKTLEKNIETGNLL